MSRRLVSLEHKMEVQRAQSRKWGRAHPDIIKEWNQRYQASHRKELNIKRMAINKPRYLYAQLRAKVFFKYGCKCVTCGVEDLRVLTVSHKNGGGMLERGRSGNGFQLGTAFYNRILREDRDDIIIQCANCNILQGYKLGERQNQTIEFMERHIAELAR